MEYQDGIFTHGTLEDGEDFFITDRYKRSYHFRIDSFPLPSGLIGSQFEIMFVVDSKRIRIEDFVRMIEEYQGYNIKISFHDMADDRRVNDKFFNK